MEIGVVTGAGRGDRLQPVTHIIPKPFLPIAIGDDGAVDSCIGAIHRALVESGISRVVLAGNGHPWFDQMAAALDGCSAVAVRWGGEWLAVRLAVESSGVRPDMVVVVSGDNVIAATELGAMLNRARTENTASAVVGVAEVEDLERYCRVQIDATGRRVVGLAEKEKTGEGRLAKTGVYCFVGVGVERLLKEEPSRDRFGECSLTETLRELIDTGEIVIPHQLNRFIDIGTPAGLAAAVGASRGITPTLASVE